METNLKLIKVLDIEEKKNKENKYIRLKFQGIINNDNENKKIIKTSMSFNQWQELKKAMGIYLNEENEIITKNSILLKFDENGKTKSQNPKLLIDQKKGTYKGYDFDYLELNVGVLIQNGIVQKGIIKKDFSNLFKNDVEDDFQDAILWE